MLVKEFKRNPFLWNPAFVSAILALADDIQASGDQISSQPVKVAIRIRNDAITQMDGFSNELIHILQSESEKNLFDLLQQYPIMQEPESEELYELRAGLDESDKGERAFFLRIREYLSYLRKATLAMKKLEKDIESSSGERITIEIPNPPLGEALSPSQILNKFGNNFPESIKIAHALIKNSLSIDEAVTQIRSTKPVIPLSGDSLIDSILMLANLVRLCNGQPDTVAILVKTALEAIRETKQLKNRGRASALFEIARLLVEIAPFSSEEHHELLLKSIEANTEALELIESDEVPRFKLNALLNRGNAYDQLGAWDPKYFVKAEEDYRAALEIPGASQERPTRGALLTNVGNTIQKRTDIRRIDAQEEAISLLDEAIQVLEGAGDVLLGNALLARSVLFNERHAGDFGENQERALRDVAKAIERYKNSNAPAVNRASALLAKGNILRYRAVGSLVTNLQEAEMALQEAIKITPVAHKGLYVRIRLALGQVFLEMSQLDTEMLNKIESAVRSFEEARSEAAEYPILLAHVSKNLGDTYRLMSLIGNHDLWTEAEKCFITSKEIYDKVGAEEDLAYCIYLHAILAMARWGKDAITKHPEVLTQLERSFNLFERHGARERCLGVASTSLRLLLDLDKNEKGYHDLLRRIKHLLEKALNLLDSLWDSKEDLSWRIGLSEYGELGVGYALCDILMNGSAMLAWSRVSKYKARQIQSELVFANLIRVCPEHLKSRIFFLRDKYMNSQRENWIRDRKTVGPYPTEELKILSMEMTKEFRDRIQSLKPIYGFTDEFCLHEQIDEELINYPNTTFLDLSLCKGGGIAIIAATDKEGHLVSVRSLPLKLTGPDMIEQCIGHLAKSYSGYCYAQNYRKGVYFKDWAETVENTLNFLSSHILDPLWPRLAPFLSPSRVLILILGEGLNSLPFHAAPLPGEDPINGKRICDAVGAFANAPNASVLAHAKSFQSLNGEALLVLSDCEPMGRGLVGAPREIAMIATSLLSAGSAVTILAGKGDKIGPAVFEAMGIDLPQGIAIPMVVPSPKEVLSRLTSSSVFVYSGHARGTWPFTEENGLVLMDPNNLTSVYLCLDDLITKNPLERTPLVLLSGCETGYSGPVDFGAEHLSVTGGLLRLGASAVCSSLTKILASDAEFFFPMMVKELARGSTTIWSYSKAIRKLREKLRSNDNELLGIRADHPVRWSPFILTIGSNC